MQIGTLDRRVVIQSPSTSVDTAGQPLQTWSEVATVWANVSAIRGKEPFQGEVYNAQRTSVFTIRWRTDVDETMQILHDGDTYDIISVIEIGRREGLEIAALTLVPA